MFQLGRPDVIHRRAAGKVEAACKLTDFGIDRLAAFLGGQRQPLVTVDHEVRVIDLVDKDWRVSRVRPGLLDLMQEATESLRAGPEAPVELVRTADGSHDLVDRDLLDADVQPGSELEPPSHLLEVEKDPAVGRSTPAHELSAP